MIKLNLKKIISIVLTLTLLCSFSYNNYYNYLSFTVYADGTKSEFEIEKENDNNLSGIWDQAKEDGCSWNFFHNAVQLDIATKPGTNYGINKQIIYTTAIENPVSKEKTNSGFVDVYQKVTPNLYKIWEVKPVSYRNPNKRGLAQDQLENYVDSTNHLDKSITFKRGGYDSNLNGEIEGWTTPLGAEYKIKYWCEEDSLIFYKFERTKERQKETVEQEETEEEKEKKTITVPALEPGSVMIPLGVLTAVGIVCYGLVAELENRPA